MVLEYIAVGLGVLTGIAAAIAYIYRRGISQGIDTACGKRIEKKLDAMQKEGDTIHNELKKEIGLVHSAVDNLQGSFNTFLKLTKK